MADYELSYVTGNVGGDPEERDTPKGKVVAFSVAQAIRFGKDAPKPKWVNIAIWDNGMRALVMSKIRRGVAVTVAGKMQEKTVGDRTYYNMHGYRVGFVEYLFPLDKTPSGQPPRQQTPSEAAEDDLPF